jgi:DNA polymerase-3 subunit epsilon
VIGRVLGDGLRRLLSGREAAGRPILEASYTVLDTELTGLDPRKDSIISVGAVRLRGEEIVLGETFYSLVNPESELCHEGIFVHGLTPSDLEEKPCIGDVLRQLTAFCGSDVVVGHFVGLDMAFLNREARQVLGAPLPNPVLDTCRIHEWIRENRDSFGRHYQGRQDELDLFTLAREYGVPVSEGHHSLGDAFMTAQLFQRFLAVLPGMGVRRLGDLLRIGHP